MDVHSESNELETRPKKKPYLAEIREKLLCSRKVHEL